MKLWPCFICAEAGSFEPERCMKHREPEIMLLIGLARNRAESPQDQRKAARTIDYLPAAARGADAGGLQSLSRGTTEDLVL